MPAKFDRCVKAVKKTARKGTNAYAVCNANAKRTRANRGKKNSSSAMEDDPDFQAAKEASEEFHGTEAHEMFEVNRDIKFHQWVGDCGELVKLEIKSINGGTVYLKEFGGTRLARNPKGTLKQLYIEGGDQSVDLEAFEIYDPHELEVLGKLKRVWYYTIKHHLGKDGGEANYRHRFGDNPKLIGLKLRGNLPEVIYDSLNETLSIAGGDYDIEPEGIDN